MLHRNFMIILKENIKQKLKNIFGSYKALSLISIIFID